VYGYGYDLCQFGTLDGVILIALEFPVESGEGTHGYAFFHRFPDRSIDEADITARTPILADFLQATTASYGVTRAPVAIGFSNGAIMAAALLLMRPGLLAGAILFRPLSSFAHDPPTGLDGTPVLITGLLGQSEITG
jgi:predicted esterase